MTPFHLTETVRFVQNNAVFDLNSKKKEELNDMSSDYCSSSFVFLPEKLSGLLLFKGI
jgi:hypothetical protein